VTEENRFISRHKTKTTLNVATETELETAASGEHLLRYRREDVLPPCARRWCTRNVKKIIAVQSKGRERM